MSNRKWEIANNAKYKLKKQRKRDEIYLLDFLP